MAQTKQEHDDLEERIVVVLGDGPLDSADLLDMLGIEPCGGEIVVPIQNLIEQRIVKRRKTYIYELNEKVCRLCGTKTIEDTSLLNCNNIEVPVCDSCVKSVHHLCDRNPA